MEGAVVGKGAGGGEGEAEGVALVERLAAEGAAVACYGMRRAVIIRPRYLRAGFHR